MSCVLLFTFPFSLSSFLFRRTGGQEKTRREGEDLVIYSAPATEQDKLLVKQKNRKRKSGS